MQQDRQNYEDAIDLLRRAVKGKESVDEEVAETKPSKSAKKQKKAAGK